MNFIDMDFVFIYLDVLNRPTDISNKFYYHYKNKWFDDKGSGMISITDMSRATLVKTHSNYLGSLILK